MENKKPFASGRNLLLSAFLAVAGTFALAVGFDWFSPPLSEDLDLEVGELSLAELPQQELPDDDIGTGNQNSAYEFQPPSTTATKQHSVVARSETKPAPQQWPISAKKQAQNKEDFVQTQDSYSEPESTNTFNTHAERPTPLSAPKAAATEPLEEHALPGEDPEPINASTKKYFEIEANEPEHTADPQEPQEPTRDIASDNASPEYVSQRASIDNTRIATTDQKKEEQTEHNFRKSDIDSHSYEEEIDHDLLLSAIAGFTTLTATDISTNASATLNSEYEVGIRAAWKQHWAPFFATYFESSFRQIKFQPSTNREKSLQEDGGTLMAFALGSELKIGRRLNVGLKASYANQLVLYGFDSSSVTIDSLPTPSVGATVHYDAYRRGRTFLGLNAGATYMMSTTSDAFTVDPGTLFEGAISVRRDYGRGPERDRSFKLSVGLSQRTQNSSLVELSERRIFATLTLSLPIFEDSHR